MSTSASGPRTSTGWDDAAKFFTLEPIAPGGESLVYVEVINYGGATAQGFKIDLQLPEHATLTEPEPDCVFSADLTSASSVSTRSCRSSRTLTSSKVHRVRVADQGRRGRSR